MEFWTNVKQEVEALCNIQAYIDAQSSKTVELTQWAETSGEEFAFKSVLAEVLQDFWLCKLMLQKLKSPNDTSLCSSETKLNPSKQQVLVDFCQEVDVKVESSVPEAQGWLLSQQKDLQQQLKFFESKIVKEFRTLQRHAALSHIETQKALNESPIWAIANDLVNASTEAEIVPLRIFLVTPMVPLEGKTTNFFADLTKYVEEYLRNFCDSYTAQGRPIEFLAGGWMRSSFCGEAAVGTTFASLKTEPSIILESSITTDSLNLHIGYWGLNWSTYCYRSSISNLDCRTSLHEIAKQNALAWKAKLDPSVSLGEDPEFLEEQYGAATNQLLLDNLKLVDRADNSEDREYKLSKADVEQLRRIIANGYCIFTGLLADAYFLMDLSPKLRLTPLLPQMLPNLLEGLPEEEAPEFLKLVTQRYQRLYRLIEEKEFSWVPDLSLDLAQSLSYLPDQSWARGQVVRSMRSWLGLRGIEQPAAGFDSLLDALQSALHLEDREYVQKLNRCLAAMEGNYRRLSFVDIFYSRGLEHYKSEDFQAAIADFNNVLQIDARHAKAFFYRGCARSGLGLYQQAVEDFNDALQIDPDYADAYNYRGNAYKELGDYDKAIADYDRALALDPESVRANSDRNIAQSVLQKIHQPRSEESPPDREFEFAVVKLNVYGREARRREFRAKYFVQELGKGKEGDPIQLEMVCIPGGVFSMGSSSNELNRESNEGPQHWVGISSFFMGKFPITQAQWRAVAQLPQVNQSLNPDPSHFKGANRPVESVSWHDAVEFCDRLTKVTGLIYRLPSEAEWEYACRGGMSTPFHFGQTISTAVANYDGSYAYGFGPNGEYCQETTEVGSFQVANAFGLYDLHGQVAEWCYDSWHANYQGAPSDGRVWEAGADPTYRILRGGSWFNVAGRCRAAARSRYVPDVWLNQLGFRVAVSSVSS